MIRALLTIWAAKLAALALRVVGRAGTHVPGRIARRLDPRVIAKVAHPTRVVVVTGTNGKTTVSNLLVEALEAQGLRVASNRNGSNLAAGVAMALIGAVTWTGRSRSDIAVLEMDERSARLILPDLKPDLLVCMNLTRDSIKRNAHPAYIAWVLSSALPESTGLVLNADDLIASSIGGEANPRPISLSMVSPPTGRARPEWRWMSRSVRCASTAWNGSTGGSITSARRSARPADSARRTPPTVRAPSMPPVVG